MSVTYPNTTDPHWALADELGITREEAKLINHSMCYKAHPLGRDKGTAFSLLRCHEIARLWFQPWGAAKGEMWEWLTQGQAFDVRVAIQTIRKFLPDAKELNAMHPLVDVLKLRDRLTKARALIVKAEIEDDLIEIEAVLRPVAFILKQEGHKVYQ